MEFDRLFESVLDKTKEFVEFIIKRAAGAANIEKLAQTKYGRLNLILLSY